MSVTTEQPPFDRISKATNCETRRAILLALYDPDRTGPIDAEDVEDDDDDSARIDLEHAHFPILEDLGYITWDRDEDVIRPGPRWNEIQPFLRLIVQNEDQLPSDYF